MEKDSFKLWKLTKLPNGDRPEKAQAILQSEEELIVQKEAANCWQSCTKEESNLRLPRERTSQVREQPSQLQKQPTSDKYMSQPITTNEF